MSCLPLTDPATRQQVRHVHLGPVDCSRLTNGVRGRGPRIRGAPPGGLPLYGPAWRPFCAFTLAGLVRSAQRRPARLQCARTSGPPGPKAPRRPVGGAGRSSTHTTAARAGTSRARSGRTSLSPHRRSRGVAVSCSRPARESEAQVARGRYLMTNRARRESSRHLRPYMGGPPKSQAGPD